MKNTLYEHCVLFRNAIEKTDKTKLPVTFESFPGGSCGETVLLLGHYLISKGFGEFDYMLGELDSEIEDQGPSHAWLQQKKLIVDITADQFEDFNDPIFVKSHSLWHENFNGEVEHEADFFIYQGTDNHTFNMLNIAYSNILDHIS